MPLLVPNGFFKQLGRLARAGFTGDAHDLVVANRGDDVFGAAVDRQIGTVVRLRQRFGSMAAAFNRGLQPRGELLQLLGTLRVGSVKPSQALALADQPADVALHQFIGIDPGVVPSMPLLAAAHKLKPLLCRGILT